MWVQSLGWEDPLEEGMATHSNILAWRISWTEEPGVLQSIASPESDMTEAQMNCQYSCSLYLHGCGIVFQIVMTDMECAGCTQLPRASLYPGPPSSSPLLWSPAIHPPLPPPSYPALSGSSVGAAPPAHARIQRCVVSFAVRTDNPKISGLHQQIVIPTHVT